MMTQEKLTRATMPKFDLLTAGFPCQSFSVAGKRKGFLDPRGALFLEIARLVRAGRPSYLLLENVPGLLSHDEGRTFAAILGTLSALGYRLEWQVLNSKDFGVPQSWRRVYIVGYLDPGCAGEILPIRCTNRTPLIQIVGGRQDSRVYSIDGLSKTLLANSGGAGGKTGLYYIQGSNPAPLLIKEATKRGYKEAVPGDSVNLSYANQNQKRGRVGKGIANTLDTGSQQGVVTPAGRIRRLTPRECFRLQGFEEDQIDRILSVVSDSQAYKQAGNAVTVNVVHALAVRLRAAHEGMMAVKEAA